MFSWVLYVCEIFWFQSLLSVVIHGFSIDISAFHLNPPPFFFFIVVVPGANPGCECARSYAISYLSIE